MSQIRIGWGKNCGFPFQSSDPVPHLSDRHACSLGSILILFLSQPTRASAEELSAVRSCAGLIGKRSAPRATARWEGRPQGEGNEKSGTDDAVFHYADVCVHSGVTGGPECHGGHAATQLEGECRCGLQYHDCHLADAGTVDGLHLVQHRSLQLLA